MYEVRGNKEMMVWTQDRIELQHWYDGWSMYYANPNEFSIENYWNGDDVLLNWEPAFVTQQDRVTVS